MKSLAEEMSKEIDSLNLAFMLHASVGYAVIDPSDEGTIDDYIDQADKYMYADKEKCISLWIPFIHKNSEPHMTHCF